ncbi:MAG: hypothetical protein ACLQVD_19095 [Capsulimonadaceae bacterium]
MSAYRCMRCTKELPAGVTSCPFCGLEFDEPVPAIRPEASADGSSHSTTAGAPIDDPIAALRQALTATPEPSSDSQSAASGSAGGWADPPRRLRPIASTRPPAPDPSVLRDFPGAYSPRFPDEEASAPQPYSDAPEALPQISPDDLFPDQIERLEEAGLIPPTGSRRPPMIIYLIAFIAVAFIIVGNIFEAQSHAQSLADKMRVLQWNVNHNAYSGATIQPDANLQYATGLQYPYSGQDLRVNLAPTDKSYSVDLVEAAWVGELYGCAILSGYSTDDAGQMRVHFFDAQNSETIRSAHDFPGLVYARQAPTLITTR